MVVLYILDCDKLLIKKGDKMKNELLFNRKLSLSTIITGLIFCILFASCSKSSNAVVKPPMNPTKPPVDITSTAQVNPKKGAGWTTSHVDWSGSMAKLNISWHYDWGSSINAPEPKSVEFVPMFWGAKAPSDSMVAVLKQEATAGQIHYLLGFNEPDNASQSNIPEKTAIALWPQLMKVGVPLGSPACVNPLGTWMQAFMHDADSLHYRVDFITVHNYGGGNAINFFNTLQQIYDLYKLPIWITEFAVADFSATSLATNKYTPAQVLTFMRAVLPTLDTLSYVHRYAWYSGNPTDISTGPSCLFNADGSLSTLGTYYANH